MKLSFEICLILCLYVLLNNCLVIGQSHPPKQTDIIHTLQKDLDSLEEKLKLDLNEKFSKLSAQLDENDRRVKKTLSIFEAEWTDKSKRLSDLEERQQRVELSIMRLTKLVNELRNGQISTSTEIPPIPYSVLVNQTRNRQITTTTIPPSPKPMKFVNISEIETKVLRFPEIIHVSENENTTKTYVLIGTRNNFKILETIPPEAQTQLSSIQLEYVELSPQVLLDSLKNCSKLKSLKLIQVKVTGEFEAGVHLPQLNEFIFDRVGVLEFSNHSIFSKWSEVDDFLRGFDAGSLKSAIFFHKENLHWNIEAISDLETNIDVMVDGVKLFGINHDRGELNSMLKFSQGLVQNLHENFHLQKLAVSAWRLDLDALPDTLTHLNFNFIHYARDIEDKRNLTEEFAKLKSLQELNTFIGNQVSMSGQGWLWNSLPDTLKNLTIRFSDVNFDPYISNKLILENLYLHYCKFNRFTAENFHNAFESRNVAVTFRAENQPSRIEHELLRSILRTNATWIFMQNFNRAIPTGKDSGDYWTIENFLFESGISQFVNHFILQKRNGSWEGWNLSKEGQLLLTFQLVGTHEFVTYETYKKIIG